MGKRANREGSIYKDRARGKWVAAATVNGKRIKRYSDTQAEAKRLRDELLKMSHAVTTPGRSPRTVSELMQEWLEAKVAASEKSASTQAISQWAINHLQGLIGDVRLSNLHFSVIEKALKSLAGGQHRLSKASLIKIRSTMNQACSWAVKRDYLAVNPVSTAELPLTRQQAPKRSLNRDQVREFCRATEGDPLEALWLLCVGLGLRSAEVRALQWRDWNPEASVLAVRRSLRSEDGRQVSSLQMKTAASKRTMSVPLEIAGPLEAHRLAREENGWIRPDDLIFATTNGRPLDAANLRRSLRRICQKAAIPQINVHELRHTCASILADEGLAVETIADLLGHKNVRTTYETYRHIIGPSVNGHVTAISKIFSDTSESG